MFQHVGTVSAVSTVGFSFDDEPTINSQDELVVATSGCHNVRRRSNCNIGAWEQPNAPIEIGHQAVRSLPLANITYHKKARAVLNVDGKTVTVQRRCLAEVWYFKFQI